VVVEDKDKVLEQQQRHSSNILLLILFCLYITNLIQRSMTVRKMAIGILFATIFAATLAAAPIAQQQSAEASTVGQAEQRTASTRAPPAISGENVYVAWWTNKTANNNEEIMFRASTDGGATFGDKINLSNTTNADSWRAEIDSDADSIIVTWWETNQTADTPVMRVSDDNGATFGPMLVLATNGTLGEAEAAEGEEGEGE
jgi:hypothetical protein